MIQPAPHAPPPQGKMHPLLIGCLAVAGLGAFALFLILVAGVLVAKHEDDAKTPAQRLAENAAHDQQLAREEAERLAPTLDAGKAAQARIAKSAAGVAATADLKPMPCPHADGASLDYLPVDAELLRRFHGAIPRDASGTAWFRHQAFTGMTEVPASSYPGEGNEALAAIAADKKLTEAGRIGVIHTIELREPRLLKEGGTFEDGSFEAGHFSGWIQLLGYPDGKTVCEVPFSAQSSHSVGGGVNIGLRIRGITVPITGATPKPKPEQQVEEDFQSNFWKAAQAAIDR